MPYSGAASHSVADFTNMHPSASSSTLVPSSGARSNARSATGVTIPSTAYPPLRHTWNRIRSWCETQYEEMGDTLNWPCTEAELDDLEMTIGFTLPSSVRDSYLCCNGQELESSNSCSDGLFFGLALLSIDQIAEEWRFWRAVDEDPMTGSNAHVRAMMSSCPPKWVREEYSCRGWIPLVTDHVGNYIGVDLSPHPSGGGAPGQVIIFGRDFDTKVVLWRGEGEGGWGRFLQFFAEELEGGEVWALEDTSGGSSEEEEDNIGYNSYFSNGGSGPAGGGDRGGEGQAGFRLTGEYRGWPVLEAWADRSLRAWSEVGLLPGKSSIDTPSLRLEEPEDLAASTRSPRLNENGEALDAEGSGSRRGSAIMEADEARINMRSHPLEDSTTSAEGSEPPMSLLSSADDTTPTGGSRRVADMLSPPLPDTKASRKQKQREESAAAAAQQTTPRRRPQAPPAPAAPLDLPTIADVRAAHAAALAAHERSHHFEFEKGEYRDLGAAAADKADALELENRASADSTDAMRRHGTMTADSSLESGSSTSMLNEIVVNPRVSTSTAATSPRESSDAEKTATAPDTPRASGGLVSLNGELPNLIDPNSVPNSPAVKSVGLPSAEQSVSSPGAVPAIAAIGAIKKAAESPTRSRTNSIKGALRNMASFERAKKRLSKEKEMEGEPEKEKAKEAVSS